MFFCGLYLYIIGVFWAKHFKKGVFLTFFLSQIFFYLNQIGKDFSLRPELFFRCRWEKSRSPLLDEQFLVGGAIMGADGDDVGAGPEEVDGDGDLVA